MEHRDLHGTVAVITGASAGIGAATARILVSKGARVVLGARRGERLEAMAAELGEEVAVPVAMDVRDPSDSRRLIDAAIERFGQVDALVACAGVGLYGGILEPDDEELEELMDTNFAGTVWPVRAVVAAFDAAGNGGDVVIVSSASGLQTGGAREAVYSGTKHAQVGFAGALDREVRERGIRVTTICPAGTNSEFAIGKGRNLGDPRLETFMRPEDVGDAIVTVLQQPRSIRTTLLALWSMQQGS